MVEKQSVCILLECFLIIACKRSLGQGNISEACVKNSVHRCRGYPSMHCRWYPSMPGRSPGGVYQYALQVSRPTPKGELEGSGQRGEWIFRPTPRGCIPACNEADSPPADGYCCGWYASYWNAFLLTIKKSHRLFTSNQ